MNQDDAERPIISNPEPQTQQPINQLSRTDPDSSSPLATASVITSETSHQNPSYKLKIGIIVIAFLMIVTSVIVTLVFTHNAISSWDVLSAGNSATELSSDLSNIDSEAKSLETSSTLSDFGAISNSVSKYIGDAENQFNLLKMSPVLRNSQVRNSFTAFKNKWSAYDTYVMGTANDYKTLGPILVELNDDQQSALMTSRSMSANFATELVQYSTLINSIGQQASSLSMQTLPDQQLINNLKEYIKSSNVGITQAQSDLSASKGVNVITTDVTSIAAAAATFSNEQNDWASSSYMLLQRKEPSSQITVLISAIKSLSKSATQQ